MSPICPLNVVVIGKQKSILLRVYKSVHSIREHVGKQLWNIHWYPEAQDFLENLDPVIKIRFVARIGSVKESTITEQTEAEYLERHLWECREERDTYRLIFSYTVGKRIVLLHGFHSQNRQATPLTEIEIAAQRLASFV